MIRRKEECITTTASNVRGGNGQLTTTAFLTKEEMLNHARVFCKGILKPGCSVGYHPHENDEEFFYILKGNPTYQEDDKEYLLNPGDCTLCEDGHSHGIVNNSDEDVEYIALIILK